MLIFNLVRAMPIYEYVCNDCGDRYERIVMKQDAVITCPRCGSSRHTIQLSVFSTRRSDSASESDSSSPSFGCGCTPTSCGCK